MNAATLRAPQGAKLLSPLRKQSKIDKGEAAHAPQPAGVPDMRRLLRMTG